jgi:hypothetical protein
MLDSNATGLQGATKLLFYLVIALSPTSAYSSTISYAASNISGNTWRYEYVLANDTPGSTINEFTIFFHLGLYSTLSVLDSPAQWDSLVGQPDPNIPDDGFLDALALSSGLAVNHSISGFSVSFNWLGAGIPGSQTFNVVDPQTFAVLETEQAQSTVPEPNSASLLSLGLLGLLLSM